MTASSPSSAARRRARGDGCDGERLHRRDRHQRQGLRHRRRPGDPDRRAATAASRSTSSGETLDGDQLDLADLRGKVVVVNVWGVVVPRCRTETPLLVDAADELPGDATVVGIDIRDSSKDNALAFVRVLRHALPVDLRRRQRDAARASRRRTTRATSRAPWSSTAQGRVAALIRGAAARPS